MTDCLFCKIANKEIPAEIVFESDDIVAFRDINPQAPQHVLIIPRRHIPTLNDLNREHSKLITELILTSVEIARRLEIEETGYRTVFNCNRDAGQVIYHIHLHLLGGKEMGAMC